MTVNPSALLHIKTVDKNVVRATAKKLKKELTEKQLEKIKSIQDFKDFFPLDKLARKSGKVGVVIGGETEIYNERFLKDAKYQQKVNKLGCLPEFAKKLNTQLGTINHLSTKGFVKLGSSESSYKSAVIKLSEKLPIDVAKMQKSLKRIGDDKEKAKRSVEQGIRFALLDQGREETKGKLCRILGTTADEPDFEHSLLEGEIMACEEVIEHLSRYGCQHTYEVLDNI